MNNLEFTSRTLRNRSITLDCNVLLLLVIGTFEKNLIEKFKRTSMFSAADYDLLADLIKDSRIIVTPNVLTEASNLLESFKSSGDLQRLEPLKRFISEVNEQYLSSLELSCNNCFLKFGLSDSSIYELSKNDVVAITVDSELYSYLLNKGCPVINFSFLTEKN
jgi:hypothetical protein